MKQVESGAALPAGDVGLDLTRQYYLRVIAARDGSPAAKAGLRTGDYVRAIDDTPTREMSVFEGMRALRGAPGCKVTLTVIRGSAANPHVIELTREIVPAPDVTSRMAAAPASATCASRRSAPRPPIRRSPRSADLVKNGAAKLIVDVRRTSGGTLDSGLALARLFVGQGTLAMRESRRARARETIAARTWRRRDHAADRSS